MTLIATRPQDSEFLKILGKFCYPRWALEAFVIANAERYCANFPISEKMIRILLPTESENFTPIHLLMKESNFVNPRTEMEVFAHAKNLVTITITTCRLF